VGLAAALLAGCTVNVNTEGATASETHTYTLSGSPQITLDTFDGAIEVHSWDRAQVEVVVEKQAQDESLLEDIVVEQSQDGDRISLRVRGPASQPTRGVVIGVHFSPRAKLRVAVPKASTLDLRSGDGSLTVEDVVGTVKLRTEDGSIVAMRVGGDVMARTDDGAIRLREMTGRVDVESLDGSVVVSGTLTHLRAKTSDGSLRVTAERGSTIEADWLLETGDGSVEVRLPEGLDAVVDAVTSDGVVRSSHAELAAPRSDGDDGERGRRELKATLGAGGHTVRVRTGDGSIRFESR
jgi:hypothetical protein